MGTQKTLLFTVSLYEELLPRNMTLEVIHRMYVYFLGKEFKAIPLLVFAVIFKGFPCLHCLIIFYLQYYILSNYSTPSNSIHF
jgi:hypothetical protein